MVVGSTKNIIIVGGGMAGLGAALTLLEAGYPCTIIEAAEPGGLAGSFSIQGKFFPLGYHHILAQDKPLLELLKKLDLFSKVVWKKCAVFFAVDGKTYNLTDPVDFIKFPLPWLDKIRFAWLMLYCALKKDWKKDLGSARDWVDKIAGATVRKNIFDPLMDIKYGLPSENLSANWLGSRLHYQEFSKPLGYIPGTDWTHLMVGRLVKRVEELGGKIITNAKVTKIDHDEKNIKSVSYLKDDMTLEALATVVVNTAPPHVFKKFCDYPGQTIQQIEYLDALSLIVEIEEKLPREFYLLSCLKPRYSFGGIFLLSALNSTVGVRSKTVLNFFTNLSPAYEHFRNKTAEELLAIYFSDFEKIFKFKPTPVWSHLTLIKNYSPKFLKNYANPDSRSNIKGLYFAGNYLTYPTITSTGSAFASGEKVADFIIKDYAK